MSSFFRKDLTSLFLNSLQWTEELFIIRHRFLREGIPVYRIQDFEDGNIDGTFYQQELQKVNKDGPSHPF
jgi:hypothetical protein